MGKQRNSVIEVKGTSIRIYSGEMGDFISLTDMVRKFDGGGALIEQWLRNKDTIIFLGVWECMYNADFKTPEFEGIRNMAGQSSYYLSVKRWIAETCAIGLSAKAGRYGGTFAHKDIAFEFGSWLSPEFKLYLIKEFQRLKDDENRRLSLEWTLNRTLSKLNYRIHTDAIKNHLIPKSVTAKQATAVYATEADLLNVALFGLTAKQWREINPEVEGNLREFSSVEQLLVLANLESMNAELIREGVPQEGRIRRLNDIAIYQMRVMVRARKPKKTL